MADSLVSTQVVSTDASILAIESVEFFNPDVLITVGDDQSVLGARWVTTGVFFPDKVNTANALLPSIQRSNT